MIDTLISIQLTLICTSTDYKCVQPDSLQVKEGRQLFDKSFCTGRDYSQYKVDNVYVCTYRIPPRGATPSGVALSIATASQSSTSLLFSALFALLFFSRRLLSFFLSLFLLSRTSVTIKRAPYDATLQCSRS